MYATPSRRKKKKIETISTHLFLFLVELFPLGTKEFAYFTYAKTESPQPTSVTREEKRKTYRSSHLDSRP